LHYKEKTRNNGTAWVCQWQHGLFECSLQQEAENAWDKAHKEGPGLESTLVAASFYFDHLEQHRTPRIVAKPKLRF
jgi:hypothetical protein